MPLNFVDLFAGAGGFSAGLMQAGAVPVFAIEADADAANTFRANHPGEVCVSDIRNVTPNVFDAHIDWIIADGLTCKSIRTPRIDVVVGGPPCQGFSTLGDMGPRRHDARNSLWSHFARITIQCKADYFVMENVPQLLTSEEFSELRLVLSEAGFYIRATMVNAVDFGVPQFRKRALIFGSRRGFLDLPAPEARIYTVRDAISDLSLVPSNKNWHIARNQKPITLLRYSVVPPGGNRFDLVALRPDLAPPCWIKKKTGSTDVLGRLVWSKPSSTIRTEFYKPEKGRYLHPDADRPITHREAARLQTFPDDYVFLGSATKVAVQIGNAVPVALGLAVGKLLVADAKRVSANAKKKSTEMSLVRSRDTGPELFVRRLLSREGVRYRLHRADLPGKPDIYISKIKLAIFVNGCFWHGHGCKRSTVPKTNTTFWTEKVARNMARDIAVVESLRSTGCKVTTIWSCELDAARRLCVRIAKKYKDAGNR